MYFRFADDVMFLCGAGDVVQGVKLIRLARRQHWAVGGAESAVYDCRARRGLFAVSGAMRPSWSSVIRRARAPVLANRGTGATRDGQGGGARVRSGEQSTRRRRRAVVAVF